MEKRKEELENLKLGEKELYDLLMKNEVGWQAIIYDLVNSEQLDPWNIDIVLLVQRYLERIRELEEANFFISSKVLLAASILLRLKSEILLNKHLKSIDEILFGKKEEVESEEKIEIDETSLPTLYPKTPLPRYKRLSLEELMAALNKAMKTETRRIKRQIEQKVREKNLNIVIPKHKVNIKDRIKSIYAKIITAFKKKQSRISYSELTGNKKEEKIACFLPCLHLDTQKKLFLEQEKHFDEIWIWLYSHYKKQGGLKLNKKFEEEIENEEKISQETGFDNPLANFFDIPSEIIKGNLS